MQLLMLRRHADKHDRIGGIRPSEILQLTPVAGALAVGSQSVTSCERLFLCMTATVPIHVGVHKNGKWPGPVQ
jgi:hypothetical protein